MALKVSTLPGCALSRHRCGAVVVGIHGLLESPGWNGQNLGQLVEGLGLDDLPAVELGLVVLAPVIAELDDVVGEHADT